MEFLVIAAVTFAACEGPQGPPGFDGLDGVNITTPYKENMIPLLDNINPRAEQIGSINCIHVKSGQIIGNNTDWYGFSLALRNNNIEGFYLNNRGWSDGEGG